MENEALPKRSFFVDFMYAIVVGAALPLLSPEHVSATDSVFWGVIFLLVVVLEDFLLYTTEIVPYQESVQFFPLVFEIGILFSWYLSAVAIPKHPIIFFRSLACFFLLKYLAGIVHWSTIRKPRPNPFTRPESARNLAFFIPAGLAIFISRHYEPALMSSTALLPILAAWLAAVSIWWKATKVIKKKIQATL